MKTSFTYKVLRAIGLNFSEQEYGDISFLKMISRGLKHNRNAILLKYCMYSVLLSPLNYRKIRPMMRMNDLDIIDFFDMRAYLKIDTENKIIPFVLS